jgi:hypothetical protein
MTYQSRQHLDSARLDKLIIVTRENRAKMAALYAQGFTHPSYWLI